MVEVERGIPLFQATLVEHADMVADGEGFFLVVGNQNGAGAAQLEDFADLLAEAPAQLAIQVGEGLVEQQQLWFGSQRASQRHALLLTAGQLVRVALAEPGELDQLKEFGADACAVGVLANTKGHVLRHAQVREQRVVLEHHADAALFRGQGKPLARDELVGQADFPAGQRLETGDRAQCGGLAAAGGAEQTADVAGIQMQVEVLDHRLTRVGAGHLAERQEQLAHACWACMTRNSSSAFCTCMRFSAWSQARERGSSSRSWLISSPRWAGRQCRKITSLAA